jgi:hypothetical protein
MPDVSSDETWVLTFEEMRLYRRLEWTGPNTTAASVDRINFS